MLSSLDLFSTGGSANADMVVLPEDERDLSSIYHSMLSQSLTFPGWIRSNTSLVRASNFTCDLFFDGKPEVLPLSLIHLEDIHIHHSKHQAKNKKGPPPFSLAHLLICALGILQLIRDIHTVHLHIGLLLNIQAKEADPIHLLQKWIPNLLPLQDPMHNLGCTKKNGQVFVSYTENRNCK